MTNRPIIIESLDEQGLSSLRNLDPAFYDVAAYMSEDPSSFSVSPPVLNRATTIVRDELSEHKWPPEDVEAPDQYEHRYPELERLYISDDSEPIVDKRIELPIGEKQEEIITAVRDNQLVFVDGPTSSGKSTRLGQILYESGVVDEVIHMLPRRLAAHSTFLRVKEELGLAHGEKLAESIVSFRTGGGHEGPESAPIKIFTDGVGVAKYMQENSRQLADRKVAIVLDEAHETNENQTILEAFLRQELPKHPDLRIVLASATMDVLPHIKFFSDVIDGWPPHVKIPKKSFPLTRTEEPESDVITETYQQTVKLLDTLGNSEGITQGGLIFLDGVQPIFDTIKALVKKMSGSRAMRNSVVALPLYASLNPNEQIAALRPWPSKAVKLVLATNVAESSVTIPGIRFVVDTGTVKRDVLDSHGSEGLVRMPTSRAECDQRAGRAGRDRPGNATLTRYSDDDPFITYMNRLPFPEPEILRKDLARVALRADAIGMPFRDLPLPFDIKPTKRQQAYNTLFTMGAITQRESITIIGERMNEFPVRPSLARMLHEAERYSESTRRYVAAIAAIIEPGGLPKFEPGSQRRWKDLTDESNSDYLAQLEIFIRLQGMDERQIFDHDIDIKTLGKIHELLPKLLHRLRVPITTLEPPTQQERDDIRTCIVAGLINTIYKRDGRGTYVHLSGDDEVREVSNRSLVTNQPPFIAATPYRVEYQHDGDLQIKHVVEHITGLSLSELASVSSRLSEWRTTGYAMRNGTFVQESRLFLFDTDLGTTKETVPEPSLQLKREVERHVLENPGTMLRELRSLKKELEELAHKAKDPVPQLTHDTILGLVSEATPDDVIDPGVVDSNLRNLVYERGISLDSFVTASDRKTILENAPSSIRVGDIDLSLDYRKGKPVVLHVRESDIVDGLLPDEDIFLEDGRSVTFMYKDKNSSGKAKRVGIHELISRVKKV